MHICGLSTELEMTEKTEGTWQRTLKEHGRKTIGTWQGEGGGEGVI